MIATPRFSGAAKAGATLSLLLIVSLSGSLVVKMAASQAQGTMVVQGPAAGPAVGMPRDTRREPATPATAGTATISGTVVSSDARRPVRRATVRLSSMSIPAPPRQTTTDDEGRFVFEGVSAGRVTLAVSKPGYLESLYGQRRPGSGGPGTELSVAEGERIDRLALPLARGGVLAGMVTDDHGEPAFGTEVRAFRHVWELGERTLVVAGSDRADDRGGYRIGALPPGEYVVMATPPGQANAMVRGFAVSMPALAESLSVLERSARENAAEPDLTSGYAPVYYPSSRSSGGAVAITLDTGEERAGLDVTMPFTPLGRVTGLVTSASGAVGGTDVRLIDLEDALGAPGRATTAGPDGAFAFNSVPPGRYRVEARAGRQQHIVVDRVAGQTRVMMTMNAARSDGVGPPVPGTGGPPMNTAGVSGERPLWAAAEVFVADRNTPAVVLQLEPGVTVSGRVRFDDSAQAPEDPSSFRIVLNAASRHDVGVGSATGQVAEDGTFTIADVMPGRYRISVIGRADWRAKSFEVAGQDALDTLLDVQARQPVSGAELALTTRLATLSGTLRDASGQPASAYTVVLFSDDAAHWTPQSRRVHATRPGTDGRFAVANLPAGRYRMAALDDVQEGRWYDPALLAGIAPLSIAVSLADGEAKVHDVQVAR
jgi:hypothetical protein